MASREEIRPFLQSRRSRVKPEEVGLPSAPGRRRVPGLRREEVAQLAGVSVEYYVMLKRGRTANVSSSVLDAIAGALRLDEAERRHLHALARPGVAPSAPTSGAQACRPSVHRLIDSMVLQPAFVVGRRMDVLASNRMARLLLCDFEALPAAECNLARWMLLDERARALMVNWHEDARHCVEMLRLDAGRYPDDPALRALVDDLSVRSPPFVDWWATYDVSIRAHGLKEVLHPTVGHLVLEYETLTLPEDDDQVLCVYTARGTSASPLRRLSAGPELTGR